jgi:hypothetical protein
MPNIDLSILNQRQTPAFFASSLATRPAFGFAGRIFIDSDVPSTGLYRDTGTAWVQIADPGAGTTGTLQQVTTNGNTTTVGIISNTVSLPSWNTVSSDSPYYFGSTAASDFFKIFSAIGPTLDQTEMVFQVGDNGIAYGNGGERFRFNYNNNGGGTGAKDVFIVDYDLSYFNTSLGVNTDTPTAAFDVHSGVSVIAQLNQTVATNNSLLAFQNNNAGLWRIGNFYNSGANDWGIFDVIGAIQPVTVKKTTGQVLIGTSTVGSGKLVVASATSDNGIQIVGASAPSLRIDNAESGPTKRAGLGISTATNNFIQGSADRDFCMFNGSTTASPILFGIYDTTNVQEAARISAARNFIVGSVVDNGFKVKVVGGNASTMLLDNNGAQFTQLLFQRNSTSNSGFDFLLDGTASTINMRGLAVMPLVFSTSASAGTATEAMRVSTAQNLLVGTQTDSGYKFSVNGTQTILNGSLTVSSNTTNNRHAITSVINQDGSIVTLSNIMPKLDFINSWISLVLQIIATDGGGGSATSYIFNCTRDTTTNWSSILISQIGTVQSIFLNFAGTNANPTLEITGGPSFKSVKYEAIVR